MSVENKTDKLNVLRIIAFLCVFLLHAKIFLPMPWNENVKFAWMLFTPAWAGVWIFFMLSGYGNGCGFYNGNNDASFAGVIRFYIKRLGKLIPLYWFYIFVVALFVVPEILSPSVDSYERLLHLLVFDYQEEYLSIEFGLAWYLTTLVRLYIVAPFFFLFSERVLTTRRRKCVAIAVLIAGGFAARVIMGYHISITGGNWSSAIYKPFYFNLDMFFTGFLLGGLKKDDKKTLPEINIVWKVLIFASLFALILFNSYIYYYSSYAVNTRYMDICCYVLPSVYIALSCAFIYVFDIRKRFISSTVSARELKKNWARICDFFPQIQFPSYLFHSTVLLCLARGYNDVRYNKYIEFLGLTGELLNFWKGILFTLLALALSLLWAIVVARLFSGRPDSRLLKKAMDVQYEKLSAWIKVKCLRLLRVLFNSSSSE